MSKQNNLTDFLTDVADAIRTKKGTQALIDPQDFSSEIASIQTGGNNPLQDMLDRSSDTDGNYLFFVYSTYRNLFNYLTKEDLETLNFSRKHYTTAIRMFFDCNSLTTIPVIDFSNVTDASYMFCECDNLTTVPQLDFSSATNINHMFSGCESLTTIAQCDFSAATNASYLFNMCINLTSLPMLDFSSVTDATYMFYNDTNLTSIPQFDFSHVQNATAMFQQCKALVNVPQLDFSSMANNSTSTASMFRQCIALKKLDILNIPRIHNNFVLGCSALTTFINRSPTVTSLIGTTSFDSTPIKNGTGYIYVPDNLVNDYKTATN